MLFRMDNIRNNPSLYFICEVSYMASHLYLAYENKIHKEQSIIFLAKGTLEYDILF